MTDTCEILPALEGGSHFVLASLDRSVDGGEPLVQSVGSGTLTNTVGDVDPVRWEAERDDDGVARPSLFLIEKE